MAGDSKLLNQRSDFRRNSVIRLRCFNVNSVIDDNLKWVWTVSSNMPIILTVVALSCGTNLRKVLFIVLFLFSDFSLTSLTVGFTQGTLFFEFWLEEFIIWSRLLILVMISSSAGWETMVWFEGVNLLGCD